MGIKLDTDKIGIGMNTGQNQRPNVFEYLDALVRTAMYMTSSRQEAERLVEDTVERLHRHPQQNNSTRGDRAKVFSALVSRLLETHHVPVGRRPGLSRPATDTHEFTESLADSDNAARSATALSESGDDDVIAAIKRLPPDCRLFIVLLFIEKFSYREIADMVGVSIESVRENLAVCRQVLMHDLLHIEENPSE